MARPTFQGPPLAEFLARDIQLFIPRSTCCPVHPLRLHQELLRIIMAEGKDNSEVHYGAGGNDDSASGAKKKGHYDVLWGQDNIHLGYYPHLGC